MQLAIARPLARRVRRLLGRTPVGEYIPAMTTIAAARKAGFTVEQYVERLWNQEGATEANIERMIRALEPTDTVVEIGPGTGRYLARVREVVKPQRHVIFETAPDWRDWLVTEYGVEALATDGETLAGVDAAGLIHAHGVFVYTPFLVTARYLAEIVRVNPKWVVFDFYSLAEFTDLERWWASRDRFPVILDRAWVLAQLSSYELIDEWTAPYGQGESRYFVLRRLG